MARKLNDMSSLLDANLKGRIRRQPIHQRFEAYLAAAADARDTSPEDRFWALDGLVFGNFKHGDPQLIGPRLDAMSRLVTEHNLGPDEKLAVGMKRMMFAARAKDVEGVRGAIEQTVSADTGARSVSQRSTISSTTLKMIRPRTRAARAASTGLTAASCR
jgi:hypothetical protein